MEESRENARRTADLAQVSSAGRCWPRRAYMGGLRARPHNRTGWLMPGPAGVRWSARLSGTGRWARSAAAPSASHAGALSGPRAMRTRARAWLARQHHSGRVKLA